MEKLNKTDIPGKQKSPASVAGDFCFQDFEIRFN
jgi:hypothetical protein